MSLDSFVVRTKPAIAPVCTSRSIQDRDSIFIAYIFRALTVKQAYEAQNHVRAAINADKPATHNMMAYRIMTLKKGRTGMQGPDDFEMQSIVFCYHHD